MLSICVFSYVIDTNKCPFQPNDFAGTSSRPLRLASFITEPFLSHVELDHCDGFVYFRGRGQGLAAGWVDGSALRNRKKWTQTTSCAEIPALSTGSSTCQDCHSFPLMSDPHVTIQPTLFFHHICTVICFHLFSAVYRKVTHCKTFSTRSYEKHIQKPHAPSGKRIRFSKGRWTSKLLRLLQVGPPIHSTKSDVKVLAKTDSLNTQKSSQVPKKTQNLREWFHYDFHLQYLIEFLYSVILLPRPRSRGPAAMFQPSHLHLRSGWSSGRLFLWFCWPGRPRRGPAELWTADSWAFHCSCAELPALSTGSSACQDCHSCPLMSDPHVTIQPTLFYMFA